MIKTRMQELEDKIDEWRQYIIGIDDEIAAIDGEISKLSAKKKRCADRLWREGYMCYTDLLDEVSYCQEELCDLYRDKGALAKRRADRIVKLVAVQRDMTRETRKARGGDKIHSGIRKGAVELLDEISGAINFRESKLCKDLLRILEYDSMIFFMDADDYTFVHGVIFRSIRLCTSLISCYTFSIKARISRIDWLEDMKITYNEAELDASLYREGVPQELLFSDEDLSYDEGLYYFSTGESDTNNGIVDVISNTNRTIADVRKSSKGVDEAIVVLESYLPHIMDEGKNGIHSCIEIMSYIKDAYEREDSLLLRIKDYDYEDLKIFEGNQQF